MRFIARFYFNRFENLPEQLSLNAAVMSQ